MSDPQKTREEWEQEFYRVRGHFADFTTELERLLTQLLSDAAVETAQLEARTKAVSSFGDKIARKNEKYADPLAEITDLAALRIILYYPHDVTTVGELIGKEFGIDWDNSIRQGADADVDRFGYRSDHYIVRVSAERCRFPEWKRFSDDRAEIQVRTVMQHAWAAVDHKMRYKGTDLPRDLRRRLFRLSALLEAADEQFASLQVASDDLVVSYEESVARGELAVALDALSLGAFLAKTDTRAHWAERAMKEGFSPLEASIDSDDRVSKLSSTLQELGFVELQQFERLLESAESWGDAALREVAEQTKQNADRAGERAPAGRIVAVPEDVLVILALVAGQRSDVIEAGYFRRDIKAGVDAASKAPALAGPLASLKGID